MILNITLPFILGIFFAYLISPAVEHFENKGIKKHISIIFVYIFLIISFVIVIVIVLPEVLTNMSELVYSVPNIADIYHEKVDYLLEYVLNSKFPDDVKKLIHSEFLNSIRTMELGAISRVKNLLMDSLGLVPAMFKLLISLIITYYIIKDGNLFKKLVFSLTPLKYRNDLTIAGKEINGILKNFIQGQLLTAAIVALIETLCLMIVGVKFPLILGIIGGIANIIPYFGPIIGAVPAVLIGLSQSFSVAINCIIVFVAIQQIDNAFISPKIIEGKIGLHPLSTILIVIIGGEFFGILGMFLAVPICASLKVVFKRVIEKVV